MSQPEDKLFTAQEGQAALAFLDRVTMTGHQERMAMTKVVHKIATNMELPVKGDTDKGPTGPGPAEGPTVDTEQGSGDEASGD